MCTGDHEGQMIRINHELVGWIIRINHECEGRIENSVLRMAV